MVKQKKVNKKTSIKDIENWKNFDKMTKEEQALFMFSFDCFVGFVGVVSQKLKKLLIEERISQ